MKQTTRQVSYTNVFYIGVLITLAITVHCGDGWPSLSEDFNELSNNDTASSPHQTSIRKQNSQRVIYRAWREERNRGEMRRDEMRREERSVLNPRVNQDNHCNVTKYHVVLKYNNYNDCNAVFFPVLGCSGMCSTSSIPQFSPTHGRVVMIKRCSCCRPAGVETPRRKLGELYCPNRNGDLRVTNRMVWHTFNMPSECRCRPCSDGDPQSEAPYY